MTLDAATLAGFLDHKLIRAIERLRATVRDLNQEIERLEAEVERRAKRRKERRR